MSELDLANLRRLAEAATPGPWRELEAVAFDNLCKYGRHKRGCPFDPTVNDSCTCGFLAALTDTDAAAQALLDDAQRWRDKLTVADLIKDGVCLVCCSDTGDAAELERLRGLEQRVQDGLLLQKAVVSVTAKRDGWQSSEVVASIQSALLDGGPADNAGGGQ